MTTYPLSEPSTIYRAAGASAAGPGYASAQADDVVARGSLADCAEILEGTPPADRTAMRVEVDDMSLSYGPDEINELLDFLREEAAG